MLIFGNGGSAAIASHVSVDLTKNAGVEAMNYNESDLITCFANDFGYEHWIDKAVNYYAKKNDILILISVSGSSPNVVNAAKNAKKNGIKHVITLTGKDKNNPLKKIGDTNIFINSKGKSKFIKNLAWFRSFENNWIQTKGWNRNTKFQNPYLWIKRQSKNKIRQY